MPDTTHWIVAREDMEPYEIKHDEVRNCIAAHGECVHLVPTRVWRDYLATWRRLHLVKAELRTYRRATLVVQAALDGYPMPPRENTENTEDTA